MELHVELSQAVAALDELQKICAPHEVGSWTPSLEEKAFYVEKCEQILAAIDRLAVLEAHQVYADGQVQAYVPGPLLADVKTQLIQIEADLWVAIGILDPENEFLCELMDAPSVKSQDGRRLRDTFEKGIAQVAELLAENRDSELKARYSPEEASEIINSRLIQFNPDAWRGRASHLAPVRVGNINLVLPSHLRLRLQEIYRTYVFGCWISTVSLCRSALEYALLDNGPRLEVDTRWPPDREGRRRDKRLSDLIDDYAQMLPDMAGDLDSLRELGNAYLHPKAKRSERISLDSRAQDAGLAIALLVSILESIYLHRRDA